MIRPAALALFNGSMIPYVKLGVTLRGLVKGGLFKFGGAEAARGSAEKGLAGESPASSQSSNCGHSCDCSVVRWKYTS